MNILLFFSLKFFFSPFQFFSVLLLVPRNGKLVFSHWSLVIILVPLLGFLPLLLPSADFHVTVIRSDSCTETFIGFIDLGLEVLIHL